MKVPLNIIILTPSDVMYMCVMGIDFPPISTIFLSNFGTVPTMWLFWFLFFHIQDLLYNFYACKIDFCHHDEVVHIVFIFNWYLSVMWAGILSWLWLLIISASKICVIELILHFFPQHSSRDEMLASYSVTYLMIVYRHVFYKLEAIYMVDL